MPRSEVGGRGYKGQIVRMNGGTLPHGEIAGLISGFMVLAIVGSGD
jgi:hypothetical protein